MNAIWIAIPTISTLGLVFGIILGYVSCLFTVENDLIIQKIDELLPQSQCRQCGYLGCRLYAEAIITHGEKINCCIPGGEKVMQKIAALLNVEPQPFNRDKNVQRPVHMLAIIDEANCIGCTKCIQICPVDAIIGTRRSVHTVIADLCTGCNLCISSCPTRCIKLQPRP